LWIQVFRGVVMIWINWVPKWCKTNSQHWLFVCSFFNYQELILLLILLDYQVIINLSRQVAWIIFM